MDEDLLYEIFLEKAEKARTAEQRKAFCESYLEKYHRVDSYLVLDNIPPSYVSAKQKPTVFISAQVCANHFTDTVSETYMLKHIHEELYQKLVEQAFKSQMVRIEKSYDPVLNATKVRATIELVEPK